MDIQDPICPLCRMSPCLFPAHADVIRLDADTLAKVLDANPTKRLVDVFRLHDAVRLTQKHERPSSYHPSLTLSQTPHGGFLVECDRFPPLTYATLGEAQAFIKGYFKE